MKGGEDFDAKFHRLLRGNSLPSSPRRAKGSARVERGKGPHHETDDVDLARMNRKYAVVKVAGKTRVVSFEESQLYRGCLEPEFSTIADFVAFHAHPRKIDRPTGRPVGIGRWWLNHPLRRQFDGVIYDPSRSSDSNTKLNLWSGFSCEPVEGDCSRYLEHVRDNVCNGNAAHLDYLISWMARALQRPGEAGETAIVLRGKEGVGKGVCVREFGQLLGPHFKHVTHAKHLIGHFNAHLQGCTVLYADEAFFAGDRGHESILKALITEPTPMIEPKGLDAFATANCVHLIMSSNSDWVVPAGADARRYFCVDVSDARIQDARYFGALVDQMKHGGRAALLHHLLHRDLSDFNVRAVPHTEALAEQQQHSRRGVDQLIEIIAHSGTIPSAHPIFPNIAITTGEANGSGFYRDAKRLVPELKFRSSPVIAKEITGERWGGKMWHSGCQRGIEFPPLTELRRRFDVRHGPQVWPEQDDWAGVPPRESSCSDGEAP